MMINKRTKAIFAMGENIVKLGMGLISLV